MKLAVDGVLPSRSKVVIDRSHSQRLNIWNVSYSRIRISKTPDMNRYERINFKRNTPNILDKQTDIPWTVKFSWSRFILNKKKAEVIRRNEEQKVT